MCMHAHTYASLYAMCARTTYTQYAHMHAHTIHIVGMDNQPVFPINHDILFDNNQYRPIFIVNSNHQIS